MQWMTFYQNLTSYHRLCCCYCCNSCCCRCWRSWLKKSCDYYCTCCGCLIYKMIVVVVVALNQMKVVFVVWYHCYYCVENRKWDQMNWRVKFLHLGTHLPCGWQRKMTVQQETSQHSTIHFHCCCHCGCDSCSCFDCCCSGCYCCSSVQDSDPLLTQKLVFEDFQLFFGWLQRSGGIDFNVKKKKKME